MIPNIPRQVFQGNHFAIEDIDIMDDGNELVRRSDNFDPQTLRYVQQVENIMDRIIMPLQINDTNHMEPV